MTGVGELLALVSLLLFSANALLIGPAVRRLPQDLGFLLGLTSNVVVAALLVLGQYALGGPGSPPEWDAIALFALGGLLTSYLGRWFWTKSIATIGPTRASAIQVSNPFFAAVAGWFLLDDRLPLVAVVYGLAVFVGLNLASRRRSGDPGEPGSGSVSLKHLGIGLLGALAYGLGNVARGAGVRDWEAPIVGSLIGAAVGLLVYGLVNTDLRKLPSAVRGADPVGRRMWLLSGVLTIGAQTCQIAATQYIPVAIAVVISVSVPVIVLPVSVIFLRREAIGVPTAAGVLLILGGVIGLVVS
ncbi:DMT family transporter [Modestobacter muralis]|uniref:DMT family transporter n=1 Tax=Modestobacter muralis TaxID=1608614 RepID=A0A6P0EU71_9ACTN|nr:DMT family transporter [Modestobacter muralis]NEK95232.1 DMT family transporter [Modestobacter muralis]NEN52120.1 DMT family transporter [Modestobacter muralis]